jgi:hydroxypyruvate reductase
MFIRDGRTFDFRTSMTTAARPADARALLTDLYWAAVTAAAPGPALRAALTAHPPAPGKAIHILALGKAAAPMAVAAVDALSARGRAPAGGLLVVPEPSPSPHPALRVAVGDHPQPGPGSFAAAQALETAVRAVRPNDEVWVLLSGGTTSLIGAPLPDLRAADLSELYRLLLGSGLDITAMNRIRKRFARWAGGRLARALAPAHVKNFTISDVIGDDLGSIGSGPCVPDSSYAAEVRTALTSAGLWEQIPRALQEHLEAIQRGNAPETPKPDDPAFRTTEILLIASNRLALEAACLRARHLGLDAILLDTALSGEAADIGRLLARRLLDYDATNVARAQAGGMNKDALLVWGGETTVTLTPDAGLGGRSQELALAAAEPLGAARRPVTLLAAGTDGRDGPTDAAGGFADRETWSAIQAAGRDPARDLATHHGYDALSAGGAIFKTGMTGTNVMDLVLGHVPRP